MKILSMLLAAGSAVALVSAAGAADLSSAPPLPPTFTPVATAGYSWTGAYIGLHGGYSWSESSPTYDVLPIVLNPFNPQGWLGGIEGGVNYQLSNNWVIGIELDAIAAVIIGGASFFGGRGTVVGVLAGVLIMGILRNGLNINNVSAFWQQILIGLVIIVAVYIDVLRRRAGLRR